MYSKEISPTRIVNDMAYLHRIKSSITIYHNISLPPSLTPEKEG